MCIIFSNVVNITNMVIITAFNKKIYNVVSHLRCDMLYCK